MVFHLLRGRALESVHVMIANYETRFHLGTGGEVVYAPDMEYLAMGVLLLITAIKTHRRVLHGDRHAAADLTVHPPAQVYLLL